MNSEPLFGLDPAFLFQTSSLFVMPFWIAMVFFPRWERLVGIIRSPWIAVVPSIYYAIMVIPGLIDLFAIVGNPQIDGLMGVLGTPLGTAISWVHFLAFDLFVGRWIYLDAHERKIHPVIIAPALFFTLMAGPLGFLIYLIMQAVHGMTSRKVATA